MKLIGFSWKEIQKEVYGHEPNEIPHDGSLGSRFKSKVYGEGYRPDNPKTYGILRKWWLSTASMTGKEKAQALGESFNVIMRKINGSRNS